MYKALGMLRNCAFSKQIIFYRSSNTSLNRHQQLKFSIDVKEGEKWDLISAVSLERIPVITKDLNEIENKFINVLNKLEFERSAKSDHEVRKENDKIRADQIKKGKLSDLDIDAVVQQTAQDVEDAYKDEFKSFTFSKRLTEADLKNDIKSINRKLDEPLLLLVKQKLGNNMYWILPQSINKKGETMRLTAERGLKECCGDSLTTRFLGNAPCGFYKYKYPQKIVKDSSSVGAKIFFFKAQLLGGEPSIQNELIDDFQWAARSELTTVLQKEYKKSVSLFLVDVEK